MESVWRTDEVYEGDHMGRALCGGFSCLFTSGPSPSLPSGLRIPHTHPLNRPTIPLSALDTPPPHLEPSHMCSLEGRRPRDTPKRPEKPFMHV